jgi:hypothetical protein
VFVTARTLTFRCVCFITAGPITKLCAWGEEESGGHVSVLRFFDETSFLVAKVKLVPNILRHLRTMQKEGGLSLWHRTVQLPDVHRRGAHGHRRRYTRQRRTAGMRPCAESADRHRQVLKPTVQDVSCAESADRHRQLLKLAVQDASFLVGGII